MDEELPTETQRILTELGVPISKATYRALGDISPVDIWRHGEYVIDAKVSAEIWRAWHPDDPRCEQPSFMPFRRLLHDAYVLGLRLDRFRELSHWPVIGTMHKRIEAFEACASRGGLGTVRVALSREQFDALQASNRQTERELSWNGLLEHMSDEIFEQLGLVYPTLRVETDSTLQAPWFRCSWNDVTLPASSGLTEQQILVGETPSQLKARLDIEGEIGVHPVSGTKFTIVDASYAEVVRHRGLTSWTWLQYLALEISELIREHAHALVSRPLYELYSLRLRELSPVLIENIEQRFSAGFVTQVLRTLLIEGISIKHLPEIFRALLEARAVSTVDTKALIVFPPPTAGAVPNLGVATLAKMTPAHYADVVRIALVRQISQKYAPAQGGAKNLNVYLLDPDLEDRFRQGLLRAERDDFLHTFGRELTGQRRRHPLRAAACVLTSVEIRHAVWRTLYPRFPHVAVLAYQELSPDLNLKPLVRISIN